MMSSHNVLFLLVILIFSVDPALAINSSDSQRALTEDQMNTMTFKETRKLAEVQLGRKLKLHERLVLRIAKKRADKAARDPSQDKKKKATAIIGFILSIIGTTISFFSPLIGFVLVSTALIISLLALDNANTRPEEFGGRGFAMAGTIIASLGTAFAFFVILVIFFEVIANL